MKDKIKVAIIGCGNIANSAHIPAYMASETTPKSSISAIYCMTARIKLYKNTDAVRRFTLHIPMNMNRQELGCDLALLMKNFFLMKLRFENS